MNSIADRREQRIAIELDAVAHPSRGRAWACTIRDFCESGMLLEEEDAGSGRSLRDSGVDARRGDDITIHFAVPGDGPAQNFRVQGKVARVLENGLGIYFPDGIPLRAVRALGVWARTHRAESTARPPEDTGEPERVPEQAARRVRDRVEKLAGQALPKLMGTYFERAREELLILARDADSSQRQNMLFECLTAVEHGGRDVSVETVETVLDQLVNVRQRSPVADKRAKVEGSSSGLSLVDNDQFEDWLAVADIISRAENRFQDELMTICLQLGLIEAPWRERDTMPLGPAVIAAAFDDAMDRISLEREMRQLLYGFFRDTLVAFLRRFYPALSKLLDDSGVFPGTEQLASDAMRRVRPRKSPSPPQRSPTAEDAGTPPSPEGSQGGPVQGGQVQGGQVQGFSSGRESVPMGNIYGTARELMQLRRGLPGPDGLPAELPWSETSGPAPDHVLSSDEILAALDRLRGAGDGGSGEDRSGLTRRLTRVIEDTEGSGRVLSAEARNALEVIDGLIGSIRSDAYVPESAKGWFDQLEVTFGKLATEDVEFLDTSAEPIHPALQLLNELAELGTAADAGDGIHPALRRQVEAILARTTRDYDGDDSVFTDALEALRPLIARQRSAFEGNLERVVRQSEGARRLVDARRAVVLALGERLGGREIPEPLLGLLDPGWRNLLVHNLLRHGPDSVEFARNLELVDELAAAIDRGDGEAGELIGEIADGLDNIAYDPGRRRQLIESLERALTDGAAAPRVTVDAGRMAELLGLTDVLPETAPAAESEDAAERRRWDEYLETARGIEIGTWLGIDDELGRTRILSVAWIGEDHAAFTLVNRKGVKVHELDLRDMVQGLVDERIQLIDEMDMPLMERASRTMLQNMHNQLAWQATHDALTGLLNRKEYERTVDRVIRSGDRAEAGCAVMFLDLDQFKIINNTSGHDAGDELLRAIVPSLRHQLRGVRGTLSRLGGDEFGVLVERCDADRAREIAEALLRAVREFRFDWEGKEYALTGSIGLVTFSDSSRSAALLLQQADSACYAAKDGGRNRVLAFAMEDEGLARRRGVMEWVARVDQVVRDDRILLVAQKIAPVRNPAGALPHYEILMRVLDEDGRPMPPIDFITAAETYDRMPSVDRWVVGHALEWMAAHPELLQRVHGFSINLSGTSLNDPGFLDFVVEVLEKTGVPANKVTFEITETAAVSSMEGANRFIARLRKHGCSFSLDDFGTGLSSYSYLRNLDVDFVKIDGVFVKDMVDSPADYAVVRSVNEVAHFMGKKTIAEFAETEAILEALAEIGVDYAQGWGVAKPKPLSEFDDD